MTWTPDVCIFHFPCHDGFMSSVIVRRRWPDCVMVPTNYGNPPPTECRGKNVLIADFSFPPDGLRAMGAKSIIVLDHHKTAEAQLKEFQKYNFDLEHVDECLAQASVVGHEPILAQFDMKRSGAKMTWDFCYPGVTTPRLINFVQDRDLWTKKYPETSAVNLYLESYGYDYEQWDKLLDNFDRGLLGLYLDEARAIERYYHRQVEEMAKTAQVKDFAGEAVPVAYVPYAYVSDVGAKLLEMHAGAQFVVLIVNAHGGTTYSLRSTDDRMDVSAVAKRYGGGGHRNAAGFRMP